MEQTSRFSDRTLTLQLERYYGMSDTILERLHVPVNDVISVLAPQGRFALKLYNTQSRTRADAQWEIDLIMHLLAHGAPVVRPLAGPHGHVESFTFESRDRIGVLFEWAPGEKPTHGRSTYLLLGRAASQIHRAADTFSSPLPRHTYDYDAAMLIDEQLQRMKRQLIEAHRWSEAVALGERLKQRIAHPALDRGICHMDLTLDNVHRTWNTLTVFDFDSAGRCWRANEPHGILRASRENFRDWLEGYRSVRPFSHADEHAVAAFGIIGELRGVAWKLGVAVSSRGRPLLTSGDLPGVVDEWLRWEHEHL